VLRYKMMMYLQHAAAFGVGGVTVAFETASQIEATLPSFQAAFIDKRNKIGRIIDEFQGRCKTRV
jgi:precorrin-6B methylase 2